MPLTNASSKAPFGWVPASCQRCNRRHQAQEWCRNETPLARAREDHPSASVLLTQSLEKLGPESLPEKRGGLMHRSVFRLLSCGF